MTEKKYGLRKQYFLKEEMDDVLEELDIDPEKVEVDYEQLALDTIEGMDEYWRDTMAACLRNAKEDYVTEK